jgi:hypothetical protein
MYRTSMTLFAAFLLCGCVSNRSPEQPAPSADRLLGIWEVCVEGNPLAGSAQPPVSLSGFLSLMMARTTEFGWYHLGTPTHWGTYHLELARLGVGKDPRIPVPLVGTRIQGDSVRLVLDAYATHGPVYFFGVLGDDSITADGWSTHTCVAPEVASGCDASDPIDSPFLFR